MTRNTKRLVTGRFLSCLLVAACGGLISSGAQAQCNIVIPPNTPLNDLGPAYYKGYQAGLYPGGVNQRPADHQASGVSIATTDVVPRDQFGNPSPTGKIAMVAIGMSNATDEFAGDDSGDIQDSFIYRANLDPAINPQLVLVDGAQPNQDAPLWANPNAHAWKILASDLTAAGVTGPQVQVVWLKQAIIDPANYGVFPKHAQLLQGYIEDILRNIKTKYPNCFLAYLSPRTRAYSYQYSQRPLPHNPEPFAYETAFGDQWTVADQINGVGNIGFTGTKPAAPWIAWGPYLWTDGTTPRSDGLTWLCSDVDPTDSKGKPDYVHPSGSGIYKVADQLIAFFKTDDTTRSWYLDGVPNGQPPTVTVTTIPSPATITAGQSVVFTASASAHNTGGSITQYAWTYDDGDYAYGFNPTKGFPAPGTYNVHVTVTDNLGNTATAIQPVVVNP